MWRKSEDSKPKPSSGSSASSVSSAQHPGTAARQDSAVTPAAVSQGIKIKGEISGHGDLCLDGDFEGKIRLASGTFTVGPNARVSAEIEAREVIIRGEVIGTLKSCERVHIGSTGRLTGDLGWAADWLKKCPSDLLITHPYVSSMPGHEAAEYLRARCPAMRILIVGGFLDDDRLLHRESLAGFEVFPKPYAAAQLTEKVKEVLGQNHSATGGN
jgi:cytoskeletal protein CcmA (bactofilin family)